MDDASACPLSGDFSSLPPTFLSWDLDEQIAVDSELIEAGLAVAGVPVATSTTQFGLHVLPIFRCPEAHQEIQAAAQWIKQFVKTV
jgi:acetyl esterase/lipase